MLTPDDIMDKLADLDRDGVVVLDVVPWIHEFVRYLDSCPLYPDGHVKKYCKPEPCDRSQCEVGAYSMADVTRAPHLLQYAMSLNAFAAAYLQTMQPRLYSLNAFWTRAGSAPLYPPTQTWHRDGDDVRYLALFFYGTDVPTPEDGSFCFRRGTHVPGVEAGEEIKVTGPAGTVFAVAGNVLHAGIKPKNERLLIWARYCITDPCWGYGNDDNKPIALAEASYQPADATEAAIMHLVAE